MRYDGKWFGDQLQRMSFPAFKKEVDSSFEGDPKKDQKIKELFALFQLTQEGHGNDSSDTQKV